MELWNETDWRNDLDLDLVDVMLDLDPGMLAWTPSRTR